MSSYTNQIKSLRWLRYWDLDGFFGWAGTFFVLRREDKTIVCDNLFLDLLIDDRRDIVDHVNNNSKRTKGYLFTTWNQFWKDYDGLQHIYNIVDGDWNLLYDIKAGTRVDDLPWKKE